MFVLSSIKYNYRFMAFYSLQGNYYSYCLYKEMFTHVHVVFQKCWFCILLLYYVKLFSNIELLIQYCFQMQTNIKFILFTFHMSSKLELRNVHTFMALYIHVHLLRYTSQHLNLYFWRHYVTRWRHNLVLK